MNWVRVVFAVEGATCADLCVVPLCHICPCYRRPCLERLLLTAACRVPALMLLSEYAGGEAEV